MHRLHRAWLVAAAGFVALLAAAAIRATFGILMEPLMDEFGWSHGAIATAASINLLVFGLSAPFAAAFTERFGLRKVVVTALSAIVVSALALTQATQLWELYVIWGLVAGVATGAVAPVLAATIGPGPTLAIDALSFALSALGLLLVRRDTWEALGGFDERFFMYGEDADLSARARARGKRVAICPDATIVGYPGYKP